MRKISWILFVSVVLISLLLSGFGCKTTTPSTAPTTPTSAAPAEKVNIRFYHWWPSGSDFEKLVAIPALEQLNKKTGGRVTYTLYGAGSLFKPPDTYDSIAAGLADMGFFVPVFVAGRFPMTDMFSMPLPTKTTAAKIKMSKPVAEQFIYKEYPAIKPMCAFASNFFYYSGTKPVRTLEDMKRLKVRVAGGVMTNIAKTLGAEPVPMVVGDIYLALQTGVIDGQFNTYTTMHDMKHGEVCKWLTQYDVGSIPICIAANKKWWDSVPDDLKPIVGNFGWDDFCQYSAKWEDEYQPKYKEELSKTVEIYTLPPAEKERWDAVISGVVNSFAAGLNKEGLPGTELVETTKKSFENVVGEPWPY